MIKIFWPTICLGIIVLAISYFRMRDGIPTKKRDKFEKWILFTVIVLLLINISLIINERRLLANEVNVCIEYYRYFPDFIGDENFYFIRDLCSSHFNELEIDKLRKNGRAYLAENPQLLFRREE